VSSPRFIPASYLVDSKAFGRPGRVEWRIFASPSADTEDQLVVAKFHHGFAVQMRRALQLRGITQQDYADRTGVQRLRIVQLLGGTTTLRLEDIATAHRELGTTSFLDPVGPSA
jgi:hypothetical protein